MTTRDDGNRAHATARAWLKEIAMPTESKPWWQSKSVWLGVVTVALAVGQAVVPQLQAGANVQAVVGAAIGAAFIALRAVTDKPLGG